MSSIIVSSTPNLAFVYKSYPESENATSENIFECRSIGPCIPSGTLEPGQILCKAEYISIQLGFHYYLGLHKTRLGDIAAGESVLKIVKSNSDSYQEGEYVYNGGGVTEYRLLWDDGRDSNFKSSPVKVVNIFYTLLHYYLMQHRFKND